MNGKKQISWGLMAIYEDQKLGFSGTFNADRFRHEHWQKFLSLFKKPKTSILTNANEQIDIYQLFSYNAKQVWHQAFCHAQHRKADVNLEDIFLALLKQESIQKLFIRFGVDIAAAKVLLKNYLKLGMPLSQEEELKKVPFEAYALAVKLHDKKIGCLMLLGALIKLAPKYTILEAIFTNIGLTLDKLEVLSVWQLSLNYQFPLDSPNSGLLNACLQAEQLEKHFGYFFEWSAMELAVNAANRQPSKDLQYKTMLSILVKAGLLAKQQHKKIILASSIKKAYAY